MRVPAKAGAALDGHVRTIALADHELGEYLRVDEIARRFDVTADDVLAACSVLGFDAHDASSLVESRPVRRRRYARARAPAGDRQTDFPAPAYSHRLGGDGRGARRHVRRVAGVGATTRIGQPRPRRRTYRAQLQSTYDATVGAEPTPSDYTVLAHSS